MTLSGPGRPAACSADQASTHPCQNRAVVTLPPPHEVDVPVVELARLRPLIGEQRYAALVDEAARTRVALRGCTVWNINSTAAGGGVAEMLQVLVGYILGAGVAVRWLVIARQPRLLLGHQAHPQSTPRRAR